MSMVPGVEPMHVWSSAMAPRQAIPAVEASGPAARQIGGEASKLDGGARACDRSGTLPSVYRCMVSRCATGIACPCTARSAAGQFAVSAPTDAHEREAEAIADSVMTGGGQSSPLRSRQVATRIDRQSEASRASVHANPTPAGPGAPLDHDTRDWAEERFGRRFEDVRIHSGRDANTQAQRLSARAFTVGSNVTFASGQYAPETAAGRHLLAHELAHVVQRQSGQSPGIARQHGASEPAFTADDPDLIAELDARIESAEQQMSQDDDLMLRANAARLHLVLTFRERPTFHSEEDLSEFVDACETAAITEMDTLGSFSPAGVELALAGYPAGFPLTWSGRVHEALSLGTDTAALLEGWRESVIRLVGEAFTLPGGIFAHGLPVSSEQLARLARFRLRMSDAQGPGESPVTSYAQAAIRHTQMKWVSGFAMIWEASAARVAEAVADGTRVASYADWKAFTENRLAILRSLPDRARDRLAQDDAELVAIETDALSLADAALAVGTMAGLAGLFGILSGWTEASEWFDSSVSAADGLVAGAESWTRLTSALQWAWDNGYLGSAASQWFDNLLAHGPQILGETASILILEMIPIVNIGVTAFLAYTTARDVIGLVGELAASLDAVMNAVSVAELQKAAHRLAGVLVNGGFQIITVLITLGVQKAVGRLRSRTAELRKGNAALTEEAAQTRALRDLTAEERAVFEQGPAKEAAEFKASQDRLKAGFPHSTQGGPRQPRPARGDAAAGVTPETLELFTGNPELKKALDSAPRAMRALRKCASPCYPDFASPTQIDRLDRVLEAAEDAGIHFDPEGLRDYLRTTASSAEFESAIDQLSRKVGVNEAFAESAGTVAAPAEQYLPAVAQLRAQPGVASGGSRWTGRRIFPTSKGKRDYRVAQVPSSIARRMSGMHFRTFDHLRETFWRMVANDPELAAEFAYHPENAGRMRDGLAPRVPSEALAGRKEWTGRGSNSVYQLNHQQAIEHYGEVYNLDNLEITSPAFHVEIGQ